MPRYAELTEKEMEELEKEWDELGGGVVDDAKRTGRHVRNKREIRDLAQRRKLSYLLNGLIYAGRFYDDDLFIVAMRYLTVADKRRIIGAAFRKALKYDIDSARIKSLRSELRNGDESMTDTLKALHRNERLQKSVFKDIVNCLLRFRARAGRQLSGKKCQLEQKLDEIAAVFSLSAAEKEVLLLLYLVGSDNSVESLFSETSKLNDKNTYSDLSKAKKPAMILTGLHKREVDAAFSCRSTLVRAGLVDRDAEVVADVSDFLEGTSSQPFSGRYFREYGGESVPLDVHTVDRKHIDTVKTLREHKPAGQGVNILLYGEPGTGKTEFARSLGRHLNLPVYEIAGMSEEQEDRGSQLTMFRYRALLACQKMIDTEKSVIVVDEADSLLNAVPLFFSLGPVAEKGQINKILDESKAFVVWITNRYDGIDDSTRRRFDYSIGFEKMTFSQRRAVWRHGLVKYNLAGCVSAEQIDALASEYEVNAGGIDVALRNASRIYGRSTEKNGMMEAIRTLMKAHLKILDRERDGGDLKKADAPEYSLEGLNIKGDIHRTIAVLDNFNNYWESMDDNPEIRNMNVLLYGPPGTGKTEFAKFIARHAGRRLIVKRASDLLNKYVGESEKNIRKAFEEAERDKAVLFIDEADSFFRDREGAVRSWEVTQVNEMLADMETFRGMLICSTNFKKIVDSAAIRRFNIKLEFDFLRPEGNEIFYRLFLGKHIPAPLSEKESMEIRSLSGLTPGDFKVVHQKHLFVDKRELSHAALIEALRQELGAKDSNYGKVMGFGA
jgi:transitional endoplasmic reticulum ATPase